VSLTKKDARTWTPRIEGLVLVLQRIIANDPNVTKDMLFNAERTASELAARMREIGAKETRE